MFRFRFLLLILAFVLSHGPLQARDMKLTIYDDGISCPAGCDAHVVMNPADNGTINAHQAGTRDRPAACKRGETCEICFSNRPDSCMQATYRGAGPPAGTFDFTPAFYETKCPDATVPAALKSQCASLDRAAVRLGYDKRINCFDQPDNAKCAGTIKAAKAAQAADTPKREACLKAGEAAYNKRQTNPKERRTNACNYTQLLLGGSPKKRWHLLLPAACRQDTYVDQFGLDCCSKSVRFAAANHPECVRFFPQ